MALNTGHDGSLSTIHANSPRDSLARLETMTLMAGMDLPLRAVREQIASAVQLILQQQRMRDGSRRVTHVTEVSGITGDVINLQDIFRWEARGVDTEGRAQGEMRPTGLRPSFAPLLEAQGVSLPSELFA